MQAPDEGSNGGHCGVDWWLLPFSALQVKRTQLVRIKQAWELQQRQERGRLTSLLFKWPGIAEAVWTDA